MIIRVKKQDSAYLYQILESYDGLANYSTLQSERESAYRDIALHIAPDFREDVIKLIDRLATEIEIKKL